MFFLCELAGEDVFEDVEMDVDLEGLLNVLPMG